MEATVEADEAVLALGLFAELPGETGGAEAGVAGTMVEDKDYGVVADRVGWVGVDTKSLGWVECEEVRVPKRVGCR